MWDPAETGEVDALDTPEPPADDVDLHAGLEEGHGRRVPEDLRQLSHASRFSATPPGLARERDDPVAQEHSGE